MKIGIKLVLSKLPIGYSYWKTLRLFEHGAMTEPVFAYRNLVELGSIAGLVDNETFPPKFKLGGRPAKLRVIEIGPGDSAFSGPILHAMGAGRSYLVDSGDFANKTRDIYVKLYEYLRENGYDSMLPASACYEKMLIGCGAKYLTNGAKSLAGIEDGSIDFIFSNAVLEHIYPEEFVELASELRRVVSTHGVCIHRVDLKDHLGGSLNNLRFTDKMWESNAFRHSGFYTNRFRIGDIIGIFSNANFSCEIVRKSTWASLPVSRSVMAKRFYCVSDDDMLVNEFDILLKPIANK